jgi:hypothetical protein
VRITKYLIAAMTAVAAVPASARAVSPDRNANGKALILVPLTLTKLDDLDFGTIVPSGLGDIVTINADTGARTSPTAGLVTFDAGHQARFASSGVNNTFVYLQLSPGADLVNGAGNKMTVTNLTLDQNGLGLRLLTAQSQVFFVGVGGTVVVGPTQAEGTYNGTFSLTAVYL